MKKATADRITKAEYIERTLFCLSQLIRAVGIAAAKRHLWLFTDSHTVDENGVADGGSEIWISFLPPGASLRTGATKLL